MNEKEADSPRRDCPWKCFPGDPACLCERDLYHYGKLVIKDGERIDPADMIID